MKEEEKEEIWRKRKRRKYEGTGKGGKMKKKVEGRGHLCK